MVIKHMPWRGSNAVLSLSLLLISNSYLFSMESSAQPSKRSIFSKLLKKEKHTQTFNGIEDFLEDDFPDEPGYFKGVSIVELRAVFDNAPLEAKQLVDHIKDPKAFGDIRIRYVMFVGPPGSGKTRTAKAIAYLSGCRCVYIESGQNQYSVRNKTNEKILKKLRFAQYLTTRKIKVIVLIDELDKLLEDHENDHYDSKATSFGLQGFLEGMIANPYFFLIGTMNSDHNMPEPFWDRIRGDRIRFESHKDIAILRQIFKSKMTTHRMTLHEECTDEFIDSIIRKLKGFSHRTFDEMGKALTMSLYTREKDSPIRYIRKNDLDQLANSIIKDEKDHKKGKKETERERQDRHLKEQFRNTLIMVGMQRDQITTGSNAGIGFGGTGPAINFGTSVSIASAPGMAYAKEVWKKLYGDEPLIPDEEIEEEEHSGETEKNDSFKRLYEERKGSETTWTELRLNTKNFDPNNYRLFLKALDRLREYEKNWLSIHYPASHNDRYDYKFNHHSKKWERDGESEQDADLRGRERVLSSHDLICTYQEKYYLSTAKLDPNDPKKFVSAMRKLKELNGILMVYGYGDSTFFTFDTPTQKWKTNSRGEYYWDKKDSDCTIV